MFAYCNNNPVNNSDPLGLFSFGDLFRGVSLLSIGIAACVAAVTIVTAGACAPLAVAAAVTFGAGAVTAVNGASEVAESVTGYNPVRDTLYGGDTAAYERDRDTIATVAEVGTMIISAASAYDLCFIEGTLVKAAEGLVPIEEIEAGNYVWAWDEESGQVALRQVVETYINDTSELVHVFVAGEEIVSTPNHPFYSPVKGWTEACRLRAGDILVLVNGEYVVVEKVQHELLEAPTKVYNFQTEGFHTYFITSVGILVHNSCGKTEVHHVVEQCQENKSGFSKSQIQSDSNKVTIPYETHRKISGYYSSKQPFSNGLRVRDWLAGKSFEEQSNFGWSVILRFLD